MPSTARFSVSPSTRPPCRWFRPAVGTNTGSPFFKRVLGIGGPSRPRRCPRPARWRGAGLDANHASRASALRLDGRWHSACGGCARARAARAGRHARAARSRARAAKPARSAAVTHDRKCRHRGQHFASSPASSLGDGRGHRRGLDGPPMPKPSPKTVHLSPANAERRPAMRGPVGSGEAFSRS